MANSYTKIDLHVVFAVKGRKNVLKKEFRPQVFMFIAGILKELKAYPLCVGGYVDHIHMLFDCPSTPSLADIMCKVKSRSSKWINEMKFTEERFEWQRGYGAFSCSRSHSINVIKYIQNQEEHHAYQTFKKEYLKILEENEVEFNENYIFEFYDQD